MLTMPDTSEMILDLTQQTSIAAAPDVVWEKLLHRIGPGSVMPDGTAMPMVLEPRPGGRWFRDLGDEQGHLWGLVQVIKAPFLLEIHGPLFMSYAVTGHIQFRVAVEAEGCVLSVRHQALGMIDPDHREGVTHGWQSILDHVKSAC